MYQTFAEIVRSWPTQGALAEAMGTATRAQVQKWVEREFIPPENWLRLVEVTHKGRMKRLEMYENLAQLAARRIAE